MRYKIIMLSIVSFITIVTSVFVFQLDNIQQNSFAQSFFRSDHREDPSVYIDTKVHAVGGLAVYAVQCSWSKYGFSGGTSCTPPSCGSGFTSLGTGCAPTAAAGNNGGVLFSGYCARYCSR